MNTGMRSRKGQVSLFEEFSEPGQTAVAVPESAFTPRISGIAAEELSPAQRKFNTLVKQIEKLREDIGKEKARISHICAFWKSQGLPALIKTSQMQLKLAGAIDRAAATMKLGARQKEQISVSIRPLMDEAASNCELSETRPV